jgi:hypothetical protein
VKTILAIALILALGITGISMWGAVHAQRMAVSSSQIFIDGTPVCVMQQAREIRASVGMCGTPEDESWDGDFGNRGGFHGGAPSPIEPHLGLPRGHPPINNPPALGEGRKILI